jgi:hypothetical protein
MCDDDCCCFNCSSTELPVGPQGPIGPQGPVGPAGSSPIDLNMVPKGTGPSITESQIFDNGVFVGINTIIPEAKVHIKSNDIVESALAFKITNDGDIDSLIIDDAGNILTGNTILPTSATNGFLYISSCAGTPIGTPTTKVGVLPTIIDSTNSKFYFYSNSSWHSTDENSWSQIGNTIVSGKKIGTLNSQDFITVTNGTETLRSYSTGEFRRFGKPYDSLDITKNGDFNNVTNPLVIDLLSVDYTRLVGNNLLHQGIFIQIEDEILRCTLTTSITGGQQITLTRGQEGTTIAPHANGLMINFIIPYAIYSQNEGRTGFGTDDPRDTVEIHLKNGLNGIMSLWRDDIAPGDVTETRGKGRCLYFFHEGGGFAINPYNAAGIAQDPEDNIHIGYHSQGFQGGIILDAPAAQIKFRNANGFGATIDASNSTNDGWVKIMGSSPLYDLTGGAFRDLKIAGCFTKENGKGLHLIGYSTLVGPSESWDTLIRILNSSTTYCNLDLLPDNTKPNKLTISGIDAVSGSFIAGANTVTVTNGIITAIV